MYISKPLVICKLLESISEVCGRRVVLAVKELIALDTGIRSLFTIFWVGSDNEKGVSVGPVVL